MLDRKLRHLALPVQLVERVAVLTAPARLHNVQWSLWLQAKDWASNTKLAEKNKVKKQDTDRFPFCKFSA